MFTIQGIPSYLKPRQQILALGTDTRQCIAWTDKGRIFTLIPSKDFNILEDFYEEAARFLLNQLRLKPGVIVFDPHPLFVVNRISGFIKKNYFPAARLQAIFHHVAHAATFSLTQKKLEDFIGVAFDGTGFGPDGLIWGGEFFYYHKPVFKRVAHLANMSLPGAEMAIREPWRVAAGLLRKISAKKIVRPEFDFLKSVSQDDLDLVVQMIDKDFNAPLTSSAGRLFDAVAALLNIKTIVSKEAEAAVALEAHARKYDKKSSSYRFNISQTSQEFILDFSPMFKEIVRDLKRKKETEEIAFRFHKTLAQATVHMCQKLMKKYDVRDVYFSGGVFMNDLLRQEIEKDLSHGIFAPKSLTTDAGIALGQIAACVRMKKCA